MTPSQQSDGELRMLLENLQSSWITQHAYHWLKEFSSRCQISSRPNTNRLALFSPGLSTIRMIPPRHHPVAIPIAPFLPTARSIEFRSRLWLGRRLGFGPLRRHQSSGSSPYPPRFPNNLYEFYHPQYVAFYTNHLAGKPRYNPFDQLDGGDLRQYPCLRDYQRYSPVAKKVTCEDIVLPRNAAGSILLRVYRSSETTSQSPIILYLPSRGTNPIITTNEHHVVAYLSQLTRATVVSVGYRISQPFPLSLHDALAALDWVRRQMHTVNLETYAENLSGRLLAVLGTGIGGSLAMSIGITEGRESGIIAAGAWTPIVDWAFDPLPGISESELSSLPRSIDRLGQHIQEYRDLGFGNDDAITLNSLKELPGSYLEEMGLSHTILSTFSPLSDNPFLATEDLKYLRSRYLATAEDFTDPFVSPLYWFSSSGVNIWTELLSIIEDTKLADPEHTPRWIDELQRYWFKRRLRKPKSYPPLDLIGKLTVPAMRIVNGDGDILHRQIGEFVGAARASLYPQKPRTIDDLLKEESDDLDPRNHITSGSQSVQGLPRPTTADGILSSTHYSPELPPARKHEEAEEVFASAACSSSESSFGDFFIQHVVKKKAGHCFITAAAEISDGVEEAENMAAWLTGVFDLEPKRASRWKARKEQIGKVVEQLAMERRRRRLLK
ncbi:hypothetical protein Dda_9087 [Drechslerella dactyloides]|uniref:Alpha/beta hydrolase fold-3 domain-containing protein n=1 Tax=Drechslerella dactyloides TaxID=74499 RepID=A0AAD6NFK2_DREDA|nr:hypothetical protein Dda_9087 [Drechslerella dactyloides]